MSMVRDIDKGWRRIVSELDELQSLSVFVGVHEGAKGSDPTGEMSSAEIAAVHEFGSDDGRIPERSFLRSGIDHHSKAIGRMYGEAFTNIIRMNTSGRRELNRLGLFGQAKIREYITTTGQSVWEDISEATKLRKGSTKILIDTGQLRRDVTYSVRPDSEMTEAINDQGKPSPSPKRMIRNPKKSRRKRQRGKR